MKIFIYPLMLMAGAGFLLSVLAHVTALLGVQLPGSVWLLHVGIFVVWIPLVYLQKRNKKGTTTQAWGNLPRWLRTTAQVVSVYVVLNFVLFIATAPGRHDRKTEGAAPPAVVRGFSGHWMLFYGAAFLGFYTEVRKGPEPIRRGGLLGTSQG